MNNLRSIAVALLNYEAIHGSFPPAFIPDGDGRPMHSWRVLILPYLERHDLYRRYDFDEPWDGPNNRQLLEKHWDLWQCPADTEIQRAKTSYVMVVGPGCISSGPESISIESLTDPRQTLLLVEVTGMDIAWSEPRDLPLEAIVAPVGRGAAGLGSNHPGRFHVAYCDGRSGFLDLVDPQLVQGLATVDRDEPLE